jgi:2'-5' RNA ligase
LQQTRRQLTLFIQAPESEAIERIRRRFNPEQYALIGCHVTLCREDEIEALESILVNLANLDCGPITVDFGSVVRFSEGKGVMIPALEGNEDFHTLRARIMHGVVAQPRRHEPHITLMHPRNSTCTDAVFEEIAQAELPERIRFERICLIEQEKGMPWRVIEVFELGK